MMKSLSMSMVFPPAQRMIESEDVSRNLMLNKFELPIKLKMSMLFGSLDTIPDNQGASLGVNIRAVKGEEAASGERRGHVPRADTCDLRSRGTCRGRGGVT